MCGVYCVDDFVGVGDVGSEGRFCGFFCEVVVGVGGGC